MYIHTNKVALHTNATNQLLVSWRDFWETTGGKYVNVQKNRKE